MNFLARAKLSTGAGVRRFSLQSTTAIRQSSLYSAGTSPFSTKIQRLANDAGTQKPTESSFSQRINKQAGSKIDWPKPVEIPFQPRVANFVNLIGRVETPVQLDSDPDSNHFAAVVIAQENGGRDGPLLIPVVFEGDLALVVARHVKERDCVFVSGKLNVGPTRFAFSGGFGNFHLVAENLNFVEGLVEFVGKKSSSSSFKIKKPVVKKAEEMVNVVSSVQIEKPLFKNSENVAKNEEFDEEFSLKWKEALENAKTKKFSGEADWASTSVTQQSNNEADYSKRVESKTEKVDEKSPLSTNQMKNGDQKLDLWRDLLKIPKQWWDFRDHKSKGLVKEKFPDFKQKDTGNPLWVDSAPDWVLPGLEKLEFDVKSMRPKPTQGGEGVGETKKEFDVKFVKTNRDQGPKGGDSWRDLVENPNNWWDNRLGKRNPRSPDFKHKETGLGLWLSDSPDWALPRLPQLKDAKQSMQTL